MEENSQDIWIKAGTLRASQPEAPGQVICLWNWSPGSWESRDRNTNHRGQPPQLSMVDSTEAQRRLQEGNSRGDYKRPLQGFSWVGAAGAPTWTWVPRRIIKFPLSHHESAGLDKHVSSARAFRGHMVTASLSRMGQVTPSRQASQWLGQSGLELISLLDHPVFFFP